MVSADFQSALQKGELLRVKIMLKDSLLVDPTFVQFDEMLEVARNSFPEILVPHDGADLEDDRDKWNVDLMNMELVQIVDNFSKPRIEHLKKVIGVVLADKIAKMKAARTSRESSSSRQEKRSTNTQASGSRGLLLSLLRQLFEEAEEMEKTGAWNWKYLKDQLTEALAIIDKIQGGKKKGGVGAAIRKVLRR